MHVTQQDEMDVAQAGVVGALAASVGLCPPETSVRPRDLVADFSWDRIRSARAT